MSRRKNCGCISEHHLAKAAFSMAGMASQINHQNFQSEFFILFSMQESQLLQRPWWKRVKLCHISVVLFLFLNSPAKQAKGGGWGGVGNDVGFWYIQNIWNQHFWNILITNKERGDLRFSYLLASLRMFSVFHPVLKACHLIMTLSSLYSLVRTCQSLLRQLIMTWRFPHSSQFRELGYLWIPE